MDSGKQNAKGSTLHTARLMKEDRTITDDLTFDIESPKEPDVVEADQEVLP